MISFGSEQRERPVQGLGAELAFVGRRGARPPTGTGPHNSAVALELLRLVDALTVAVAIALVFLISNLREMPRGLDAFLLQRISLKNLLVGAGYVLVWQE